MNPAASLLEDIDCTFSPGRYDPSTAAKVKAKFRDGVLHLTVPKEESAKARRILIN